VEVEVLLRKVIIFKDLVVLLQLLLITMKILVHKILY